MQCTHIEMKSDEQRDAAETTGCGHAVPGYSTTHLGEHVHNGRRIHPWSMLLPLFPNAVSYSTACGMYDSHLQHVVVHGTDSEYNFLQALFP